MISSIEALAPWLSSGFLLRIARDSLYNSIGSSDQIYQLSFK